MHCRLWRFQWLCMLLFRLSIYIIFWFQMHHIWGSGGQQLCSKKIDDPIKFPVSYISIYLDLSIYLSMYLCIYLCIYLSVSIYIIYLSIYVSINIYIYIYIYIYQKLKNQKLDVLEWILNKRTHFQLSQIFRLFYITL